MPEKFQKPPRMTQSRSGAHILKGRVETKNRAFRNSEGPASSGIFAAGERNLPTGDQ
jgi:hypothetical protein